MNEDVIISTFSIVGRDPETGELGTAVASRYLAVGAVVPFVRSGAGAVNTQHWANPQLAHQALSLLDTGIPAQKVLVMVLAGDNMPENRQLLILDSEGRGAAHTGNTAKPAAKHIVGDNFVAGGNTLVSEAVVDAMGNAFQSAQGQPLFNRLLGALKAGEMSGGDSRGKQSAAIKVVPPFGQPWNPLDWCDFRVDDHTDPIGEIERLYTLHLSQ